MARIISVDRLDLPELAVYAERSEVQLLRRNEPEPGVFIAESPLVIGRALDAGYTPCSLLLDADELAGSPLPERMGDAPVYTAPSALLRELTGFSLVRGALCAMQRKPLPAPETLCKGMRRIAVLEHVVNSTNVGAIMRSAAALSMDAVLLTTGCADPLYRRAARVSMGTVFQIPWTYLPGERVDIARLHEMGFQTAAMALRDDSVSVSAPALRAEERLAVLLGTEGEGLCGGTIAASDYTVRIPMAHGVDSLNVAAAAAVAFWELTK